MTEDRTPNPEQIRVLSYNLWHGRAQSELAALAATHRADVLCVQESRTATLPKRIGDLELAITTAQNRLGVALYVRSSRFTIENALTVKLTTSRHDRLVGGTDHRLAAARVVDRVAGREVVLGSFHATPFTDSNAARRRQVDDAHRALGELGPGLPRLMAGDYNHPVLLFMLRHHVGRQGFTLGRTSSSTFRKDGNIMRGKFDLATVSKLVVTSAETLEQGASDHLPVLFTMEYSG
jgi:exodeoxyribonuclease III